MENGDYVVAIDLGTNTVATVVGTRAEGGKVRIVDCEVSPMEGMDRGGIKNVDLVSKSIKQNIAAIESRQQITIREAFAGISGQHTRCVKYPYYVFVGRDGEIREEDVQKLHESMNNVQAPDGETIIQIIPQCYIVDGEETTNPVGSFGNKLEAIFNFVLGDNSAVSRMKRALQKVDIRQSGLFLNAVASAEAVTTEDERNEGVAVVDIGGSTTDVTIFYKNSIRHVGVISMGGNTINRDIRSYGILERHVENLKVKYGRAMRDQIKTDMTIRTPGLNSRAFKDISLLNLATIIEARLLDIIDKVIELIKISGCQDKLGAGIVLTGGVAQMKDLERELDSLKQQQAKNELGDLMKDVQEKNGVPFFGAIVHAGNMDELRKAADVAKAKLSGGCFLLGAVCGDKVNLVGMASPEAIKAGVHMGKVISKAAKICCGGGGGKPAVAQAGGKDPSKINESIAEGVKAIAEMIQ